MNNRLQMKKSNLLEMIAITEDDKLINMLHAIIAGYQSNKPISNNEVKIINTQDLIKSEKEEAKRVLDGELYDIERNLNKMLFLLQELQEHYFYELDARKEEDQKEILYGYEKNSTYTEIIFDNAIAIEKILKEIKCSGGTDNE